MNKQLFTLLITVLLAFAGYAAAAFLIGDIDEILATLSSIPLDLWVLVLGLSLVNYLLRYIRWVYYMRIVGPFNVPASTNLVIYFSGFALTTTPGKVGEAIRSVYLKDWGVSWSQSLALFFIERLMDVIAVLLLATFSLSQFENGRTIAFGVAIVIILVVPLIHSSLLFNTLKKVQTIFPGRLGNFAVNLSSLLSHAAPLLKNKPLFLGIFLSLLSWGAEGVGFYMVCSHYGIEAGVATMIGVYAIAMLAGAISFVPGGLVGAELTMGGLLLLLGATESISYAATFICRLATLWFAVFLGVIALSSLVSKKGARELKDT